MVVLVADDRVVVRRLMSARLRRDGHEVREASDGYEAWQAIELESFLADGAQDTAVRDS